MLTSFSQWWIKKVREIRASKDSELAKNTIFGGILNSSLPDEDKTDPRLASEAQLVVLAGEGTTGGAFFSDSVSFGVETFLLIVHIAGHTLTSALYHLLANPIEWQRLKDEVFQAVSDRNRLPTLAEVSNLRYLNAVISEAIRLHPGVMHRQVRVCPNNTIAYREKSSDVEYILPPGTCYSVSPLTSHMDPNIFTNPYKFRPQRWIDTPEISKAFMGFSKGSRGCVG